MPKWTEGAMRAAWALAKIPEGDKRRAHGPTMRRMEKTAILITAETAAERDRLREVNANLVEALEAIGDLSAGGPHTSAKHGMEAALMALFRAREIARIALAKARED